MSGLPKSTLKVLVQGQEQDVVPRLVPPGAALLIENMYFDHQGSLVKRKGSTALGTATVPAGGSLARAWALGKHQGSLVRLGRQGQAPLMVWDAVHGKWIAPTSGSPAGAATASWSRGPMVPSIQHVAQVPAGNTCDHHDLDVGQGYLCVTFQEQTQSASVQIHQQLVDVATQRIVMDRLVSTGGHQLYPHAIVIASRYACFAYNANGTLTVDVFDLQAADPTSLLHSWSQAAEIVVDSPLELASNGSQVIIGYRGQSGQFRAATIAPTTGPVTTVNLKNNASATISANVCFCWVQNFDSATWTNGYPALVTVDANGVTEHIGWTVIDSSNLHAARSTVVDPIEHAAVANVAACTSGGGSGSNIPVDILYYTLSGSVAAIKHAAVDATGVASTDTNALGVFMASRLFRDSGGASCFMVGTRSLTRATLYALPIRANPSGSPGNAAYPAPLFRCEVQNLYPTPVGAHLPSVAIGNASTVYVTAAVQVDLTPTVIGSNLDVVTVQMRNGVEPTLPAPILGNPIEAIGSMFVPGGNLMAWDGRYYGAAGFAYGPDAPSNSVTTGGSLTAGYTYSWCAVYTRVDAQGRKWRSAPSAIMQATPTAGQAFVLSVPFLQLVSEPGTVVEFYRDTQAFPGVLRKLPAVIPNVHDNPSTPFATYTDTNSDASILTGELLYTNGGIIPNAIIPGALAVAVFDNRVWFVSADDPQALWFSDPMTPPGTEGFDAGAGLFFNSDFIVDVRDDRGPITGLGVCDGRMVVFKHDACYTIEGNGPDATAANSTYQAQRIAGSVGCDNPRSIVDAFDGVWFQSSSARAGLWKLDRGTSLSYVGDGVRDLIGLPITGAVSLPEQSQIRWYTQDIGAGHVLVYDVITQAWTVYVSPLATTSADCAVGWNGGAAWSAQGGTHVGFVLVETAGLYADAGDVFGQRVLMPWLQLADLLGYQRVYSYQGSGLTIDDHQLAVNLYKDLSNQAAVFSGMNFNMVQAFNPSWEWELRLPMKLSAVQAEIIGQSTKQDGVTPTAGFAFTGISIEYGTKIGLKPTVYTHRLTQS